ncbi:hypothetical protein IAT40_004803 [Kwoniella sp. CBS 6097]
MLPSLPDLIGGGVLSSVASGLKFDDILAIGIRVALIGLLTAFVRSSFANAKRRFNIWMFPCAHVSSADPASQWIASFVARSPEVQAQIKSFRLITADARDSKRDDVNRLRGLSKGKQLAIARKDATFVGDVVGKILPVDAQSIYIRHHGNHIWVTRQYYGFGTTDPNDRYEKDHWRISGVAWQPNSIQSFIIDCHAQFFDKSDDELVIYSLSPYNGNWFDPIHRPARSWSSVILPRDLKDPLLEDAKNFLSDEEKEWYADRGIPHRRGYLLHGRPGSGKTTLATAIASQLALDIYIVNPAARGMDDGKLNKAFRNCPPQNMILIEDIDCVMPPRPRRSDSNNEDSDDEDVSGDKDGSDPGKYGLAKSTVTLSGLLNAIDGVSSQEDCILFATTNHPERLDSALSRPGRFDVQLAFDDATPCQAADLFKHFFPLSKFSELSASSPLDAAAEKMGESDDDKVEKAKAKLNLLESEEELDNLAQKFANDIFSPTTAEVAHQSGSESESASDSRLSVSMAAIQGYLLTHKKDPRRASSKAGDWANGIRTVQAEKERKKRDKRALNEQKRAGIAENTPLTPVSPVAAASPVQPSTPTPDVAPAASAHRE